MNYLIDTHSHIYAEEFDADRDEAIRRARIDCALEALVAEKGFDVTEEDIEKELAQEDDAIATREKWEKANRMAELRKVCRHSKASRWLVQTAEVTVVDVEA